MSDLHVAYISKSFMRPYWDLEYRAWYDSEHEKALDDRLALWAKRTNVNWPLGTPESPGKKER